MRCYRPTLWLVWVEVILKIMAICIIMMLKTQNYPIIIGEDGYEMTTRCGCVLIDEERSRNG